jgi:hypothetical protein
MIGDAAALPGELYALPWKFKTRPFPRKSVSLVPFS